MEVTGFGNFWAKLDEFSETLLVVDGKRKRDSKDDQINELEFNLILMNHLRVLFVICLILSGISLIIFGAENWERVVQIVYRIKRQWRKVKGSCVSKGLSCKMKKLRKMKNPKDKVKN